MQLNSIIENALIAASTGGITWFFTRKKQHAEIKASELDNVEKAISIWRELALDLGKKVEELSARYDTISQEIVDLRRENRTLKADLKKAITTYNSNN